MAKLTPAQNRLLETAERHGSAIANLSMRRRSGGAVFRCADRLVADGLLNRAGYTITEAGRAALKSKGAPIVD